MFATSHPGVGRWPTKLTTRASEWMLGLLPTPNIVWLSEMICAYLQILGPSPGTNVASGPRDTTQRGEEKTPGGRSMDAAALQRSHLELLRDLTGKSSSQ